MHLFCMEPFQSDNCPWAADKYKFLVANMNVFGQESPLWSHHLFVLEPHNSKVFIFTKSKKSSVGGFFFFF